MGRYLGLIVSEKVLNSNILHFCGSTATKNCAHLATMWRLPGLPSAGQQGLLLENCPARKSNFARFLPSVLTVTLAPLSLRFR